MKLLRSSARRIRRDFKRSDDIGKELNVFSINEKNNIES